MMPSFEVGVVLLAVELYLQIVVGDGAQNLSQILTSGLKVSYC